MPEEEARRNIVRFFDPRLHRIGFGIELMGYSDPKEQMVLIRRNDGDAESSGLTVVLRSGIERLTVDQFCILSEHIIRVAIMEKLILENGCLCSVQVDFTALKDCGQNISIYDIVDSTNRFIEYLHGKLPWKNVEDLVWQNIDR